MALDLGPVLDILNADVFCVGQRGAVAVWGSQRHKVRSHQDFLGHYPKKPRTTSFLPLCSLVIARINPDSVWEDLKKDVNTKKGVVCWESSLMISYRSKAFLNSE
jgi:hypothetical protein